MNICSLRCLLPPSVSYAMGQHFFMCMRDAVIWLPALLLSVRCQLIKHAGRLPLQSQSYIRMQAVLTLCNCTLCPQKTVPLDNVRWNCQIRTHPNQIACAWLWIYLRQKCQFHTKILFITRVIFIQILTTKYFSFQYSVTYCSQTLRRPAHRARETVHLLTHETPGHDHSSSVASQQSWP